MNEKVATLGPEYSYSHILTSKLFESSEIVLCSSIPQVYEKVSSMEVSKGIVPIENLLHGTVRESITSLHKYKVKINNAFDFPIHLCLASQSSEFNKIISKREALSQCSEFIKKYNAVVEDCSSTSRAMQLARDNKEYAAVGSAECANHFSLKIIGENIEDNPDNITRFIEVSLKETIPTEKSRTSILIIPDEDKPGILHEILSIFNIENINLTKIESIPTGKKLGEYELFIEIENPSDLKILDAVINNINLTNKIFVFGSYNLTKID